MDYQKFVDPLVIPGIKDLTNPPKELFYRGKLSETVFKDCVAVIGSRKMTGHGKGIIEKLIPKLVSEGKTIVSGFMYGVDQYAHKISLQAGGKTIAVLGWGITNGMRTSDQNLAEQITSCGGLIISEWEFQIPTKWTFPTRNRIVAALAREIYIIEAAVNSGTLLTAKLGVKLNRKIYAASGPTENETSLGSNALLAKGEAKLLELEKD